MSDLIFRCERHIRNCIERCPECDAAEIARLQDGIGAALSFLHDNVEAGTNHIVILWKIEEKLRALEGKQGPTGVTDQLT